LNLKKIKKNFLFFNLLAILGITVWSIKNAFEIYKLVLMRTNNREKLSDFLDLSSERKIISQYKNKKTWLNKKNYKNIYIKSFDGLRLYGLVINQEKNFDNWVIVVHGYNGCCLDMIDFSKNFYKNDFNIILPDCRGHGKSQGSYIGMGWHDRLDIVKWIEYINKENSNSKIVLYGLSMGAATILMSSGEKLPNNVKCIIEDCAYNSAFEEFRYQLNISQKKIPKYMLNIVNFICAIHAKYKLSDACVIDQIKKSKTPTLFIHGGRDKFVPTRMVFELYKNASCPKDIIIIPNAGHGTSALINEKKYWSTIFSFLEKYFYN
jgi:esterase/lipase